MEPGWCACLRPGSGRETRLRPTAWRGWDRLGPERETEVSEEHEVGGGLAGAAGLAVTEEERCLVGVLLHDAKNVLGGLHLALPFLREHLRDEEDLRLMASLEKSLHDGKLMLDHASAVLSPTGTKARELCLAPLVKAAASWLRRTLRSGVLISTDLAEGLLPRGNPRRLYHLLVRLSTHLGEALPEGGSIKIEGADLPLGASNRPSDLEAERWVVLSVAHTAGGAPLESLAAALRKDFEAAPFGDAMNPSALFKAPHGGLVEVPASSSCDTTVRVYLPAFDPVTKPFQPERISAAVDALPRGTRE